MTKLLDGAIFLALGSAFLYCASTASYHGYLLYLHLDSDILDRNFHQILYDGLIQSFNLLIVIVMCYWAFRFFYSHMLLPIYVDYSKKSFSNKRKIIKLKKFWFGVRKDSEHEILAKKLTREAGFAFVLSVSLLVTLAYLENKGQKRAKDYLEKIYSGEAPARHLISIKIDGAMRDLYRLVCGARNCAGIDVKSKEVFYFPLNGYSFKIE